MTDSLPDYMSMKPPEDVDPPDYSTHERRADLLRRIINAGSPGQITQAREAEYYNVHKSTISRDMDRLRESINDQLGRDAKLTSKAVFERVLGDLLETDDWRASKAAFDAVMQWNEWLADLGEQHREPRRSELDVDMRSRRSEVSYRIVREGDDEELPTTETEDGEDVVDYEALGFTAGPEEIPVDTPSSSETDGREDVDADE